MPVTALPMALLIVLPALLVEMLEIVPLKLRAPVLSVPMVMAPVPKLLAEAPPVTVPCRMNRLPKLFDPERVNPEVGLACVTLLTPAPMMPLIDVAAEPVPELVIVPTVLMVVPE